MSFFEALQREVYRIIPIPCCTVAGSLYFVIGIVHA